MARTRTRVLALVVVLALVAGGVAAYVAHSRTAQATGAASLTIFTGTVSVKSSGTTATHAARTGDQLHQGDFLTTGADTKAAIAFPDGSITRLDSSTELAIDTLQTASGSQTVELTETLGKTWNRVKQLTQGSSFRVHAPNNSTAEVRGTEFSIVVETNAAGQTIVRFDTWSGSIAVAANGTTVVVPSGLSSTVAPAQAPSTPAPIPPTERTDSWTVFNQTTDTSAGAPTSLNASTLSQGGTSGVQPGASGDGASDLDFALGWPGSTFELIVLDPDGHEYQRQSSAQPPIHIVVPRGRTGSWQYIVNDLQSNPNEVWWVVVSRVTPSRQAPTPFFVGSAGCDHTVAAGSVDTWTLTARSAAGRPSFSGSIPGGGTLNDNGDGTATVAFSPAADAPGGDLAFQVTAAAGGASAALSCVEHVRARPRLSTVSGHVAGAHAGVVVDLEPGGQTQTTDSNGTFQFTGLAAGAYTVSITVPAGYAATAATTDSVTVDGSDSATADFAVAPLPAVSALIPAQGPAAGGTAVTIAGIGFTGATHVAFGTAAATSFTVVDDAHITAVAPAQAQGLVVGVRVTTPLGTSPAVSADTYSYLAPLAVTAASDLTVVNTGSPVRFDAAVTGGAYPYTYLWDFGDGNTGSSATEFHVYTAPGRYTATVTVRDSIGESAGSGGIVISVGSGLSAGAAANPASGPAGMTTTLTATIGGGGPPYSVAWDFGDSSTGSGITTTHTYAAPGSYHAVATVTDAAGDTPASAGVTLTVYPTVSSVSPTGGPYGGGTAVTITGSGFSPSSSVSFGTLPAAATYVSAGALTATSPALTQPAPAGVYDVRVTTGGVISPVSTADQFSYAPPPRVSSTSLTASPNPAVPGQAVTLAAVVSGSGTPTGTVTFYDGTVALGSVALSGATASLATSSLSVGSHALTAQYSGDSTFAGSTSAAVTETVNRGSVSVSLSGSPDPSGSGQTVTFSVQALPNSPAAGTPTGAVTLFDGTVSFASATLTGGIASITYAALTAGTHSITAQYSGDGSFSAAGSPAWTQTVNATTPPVYQLTLTASPQTINANGTATSSIVAHAVDAFGNPATATASISVTIASSNSACCSVTTAVTVIGAGQQDSSASPAIVTSTTTQGSSNITGAVTSSPAYTVQPVTVTTTTRAIGLPAEVLAPPGGSVPFTITVNPAPAAALTIALSTLDTTIATITPSVTIAAGGTSASATLTGVSGLTGVHHTTISAVDPAGAYAGNSTVGTVEVVNLGFNQGAYYPPATVAVNAQVTLSAAAPASGLRVYLATYSDSAATTPDTSKATVPAFIDVPGGQLTSPVFQVTGVAQGTAYVQATGTGVTSSTVAIYVQQQPTLTLGVPCCGYVAAGMQRGWSVYLSYNPGVAVPVTLTSSDPTHLGVTASVTVPAGQTSAPFTLTGVAPTTSAITITATSSGWVTASATSQVSQASLSVSPYYTSRTTLDPGDTFTTNIQTPGCGQCDSLVSGLTEAITITSTPAGNVTGPATVTLPPGGNGTTFTLSQAQNAGSYYVSVSDGNSPFTDSAPSSTVTVTAPSISIGVPCCGYVAAGMWRTWSVYLSNPAPTGGLPVTLSSADPTKVTVPGQVTVLGGSTSASFALTGVAATTTPISITALAAGWNGGSATTQVSTASLSLSPYYTTRTTLDSPNTFSLSIQTPGCGQCDALVATQSANLTLNGTPSTIATLTSPLTMLAGGNAWTFQVSQATTAGTYTVSASDGNSPFIDSAPSSTVTVTQPVITVGVPCCGYVAAGMQRTWYVYLSNPAPLNGLTVGLLSNDTAHLTVPTSVTVASGQTSAGFPITGVAATTNTVTVTASSGGWTSGTATTQVSTGVLSVSPYYTTRTTLDPANTFSFTVQTPGCGQCDALVAPLTAKLALTANPSSITTIPATVSLPAGGNGTTFQAAPATAAGTYSVSASDANTPFTNSSASATVTVTEPAISIGVPCCGSVAVGMNRSWYVYLSNPAPTAGLTVNLASTAPTVLGVPATVTVAGGATSANFTISGLALGSATVNASAPAWSPGSASTSTSSAALQVSPSYTTRTTLDAPNSFTVSIQTPGCGQCDGVAASTTVSLSAASTPSGAAALSVPTVTIPAGGNSATFTVTDSTVSTYTVSAAATTDFAGSTSAQVSVTQPSLAVSQPCCGTVPAGMHRTFWVYLSNPAPTSGLTVSLASSDVTVATVPSSATLLGGQTSASFVVTALATGPVTISASASGWTTGSLGLTVPAPTFYFNNVQTSRTTTSAANTGVTVSAYTPGCGACDYVNGNVTVTVAVAGTPSTIVTVTPTTLTIAAGTQTSSGSLSISTPTATGTYQLTANSPGYIQGSSPPVSVPS